MNPGVRTLSASWSFSAVLILSSAAPARAEWQFTPFIGYTFRATSTFVDFDLDEDRVATDETRLNFGGAVRLIGEGRSASRRTTSTPGFFDRRRCSA